MEQWDKDFIDMISPGHLTVKNDGTGLLAFGAFEAELDCRLESIHSSDEGDEVCVRGWGVGAGRNM
jgi:hypothetical protein